MPKKNLYIISEAYPFPQGFGEQFFEKEILELSKYFDKIYLFPLNVKGKQRHLPDNVEVNLALANASRAISKDYLLRNVFHALNVIMQEFLHSDKKKFILKNLRELINSFAQSKYLSGVFYKQIKPAEENYFYSFWMNDGALLLSILKQQSKISRFLFRVNGFDLFDDRRKGGYMPFRYFNFKQTSNIVVLSQVGLDYLKKKDIFPEKLFLNYYGIYDNGSNPFDPSAVFTIVSCSSIIRLKRIDKIANALKFVSFPVKWIHFGDGELMNEIKRIAADLPSNIEYIFKGNVSNESVIDTYSKQSVNLFIHTSDTEGLGLAIIEAQSFGIPALAVGVGGVLNVVNDETGELITLENSPMEIAERITEFKNSSKNTFQYREKVKNCWSNKFFAKKNYKLLFDKIVE